jgi:hypothetical protein
MWYNDYKGKIIDEIVKDGKVGCDCDFPGTINISKYLNPLRYSLTPWEIERYKEVGYLTSKAIEETAQTIKSGDKECEIIGRLAERLWSNRVDYITTFCASDERITKGTLLLSKPIIFPQLEVKIGDHYTFIRPDILER